MQLSTGGGNSGAGVLTEPDSGPGIVTGSHLYAWPGIYEATVQVTDDDGGVGSTSFTVEVVSLPEVMVEILRDEVDTTDLPDSVKNSLNAPLDNAVKKLDDSKPKNDAAAINTVEAVMNKVEAQRGKKIIESVADYLLTKAQFTVAALKER